MSLLKTCDVCGTLNFKENNYCTHCGNKFVPNHVCPFCGEVNLDKDTHCVRCNEQINPMVIDNFDILFSDFNANLLLNAKISDEKYNQLLSDIFMRANYVDIWGNSIKDKILNFASIFTECRPKSRGYERGFISVNDYIFYDDRLNDSVQIATVIHELAHHILFRIIENLLCDIFKVYPSSTLQSFIWYFLELPEFKIMNEYCAHTVEGRFIPYGYQNYGSFNELVKNIDDGTDLESMIVLGNSFANEIIIYLEKYIDIGLREEIKLQYMKDLISPNYESILKETDSCLDLDIKNRVLISVLFDVFEESSMPNSRIELESIKEIVDLS